MSPLYIFDLDGTLADISHRRHFVERDYVRVLASGADGSALLTAGPFSSDSAGPGNLERVGPPKDWDSFYAAVGRDAPILPVIATLHQLRQAKCDIWIWTGRSEVCAKDTMEWLSCHSCMWFRGKDYADLPDVFRFRMRKSGDRRPTHEVKLEWLKSMAPRDRNRLVGVFEDRDSVVSMWRGQGVTVFQPCPGAH